MKCLSCSFENPEGSIFCGECGTKLQVPCGSCGSPIDAGMKFCTHCGHPQTPQGVNVEAENRQLEPEKTKLMIKEEKPDNLPTRLNPYLQREDGSEVTVDKEEMIIGREEPCDILLDSLEVSARHAGLKKTKECCLLTDFGSTNGTFVNGEAVSTAILHDGDLITFGPVGLVFHDSSDEVEQLVTKPMPEYGVESQHATVIQKKTGSREAIEDHSRETAKADNYRTIGEKQLLYNHLKIALLKKGGSQPEQPQAAEPPPQTAAQTHILQPELENVRTESRKPEPDISPAEPEPQPTAQPQQEEPKIEHKAPPAQVNDPLKAAKIPGTLSE